MKKLKCEVCGGNLDVDDKNEYATCQYCQTKYKLNEDKNIVIKLDESTKESLKAGASIFGKVSLVALIPGIIISLFVVVFIVIIAVNAVKMINDDKNVKNTIHEQMSDSTNYQGFNNYFEMYSGTENGFMIKALLDQVSVSNKQNKDHIITLTYNDLTGSDAEVIRNIKSKLNDNTNYEVDLEYDGNNYINKITIMDI